MKPTQMNHSFFVACNDVYLQEAGFFCICAGETELYEFDCFLMGGEI